MANGRYDSGERRRATRAGRQKGCYIYIPADELEKAGYVPGGSLPFYRTWGSSRGSVVVRLYRNLRPPAKAGKEARRGE